MKNGPENKARSLSDEEEKLWGFYLAVGIQGADELRKELGLDEPNFRHLAPNLNREPKKYFLYRVLDEVQKAALKIAEWKECLSEAEPDKMQRVDYETIIDDQQFRARKLTEVLVDAILFSTTNDQAHYIHAYSMSKDVHFTPHDTSSSFDEEQVLRGVDRVGLLILALIIRCQSLLGCVPEGV